MILKFKNNNYVFSEWKRSGSNIHGRRLVSINDSFVGKEDMWIGAYIFKVEDNYIFNILSVDNLLEEFISIRNKLYSGLSIMSKELITTQNDGDKCLERICNLTVYV